MAPAPQPPTRGSSVTPTSGSWDEISRSPTGYPGNRWYRDFHTFDHEWGFQPCRVTGHHVDPLQKAPYNTDQAHAQVESDAHDFVDVVVRRLNELSMLTSDPLVVAAFDTELFGHWWHEGPMWLDRILDLLPTAGVQVIGLESAVTDPVGRVIPDPGSWGLGKDWHIWTDPHDMAYRQAALAHDVLAVLDGSHPRRHRSPAHDQLIRETLLALSSDWAFMVSHDTAADYAHGRFTGHADAAHSIMDALRVGDVASASTRAEQAGQRDHPFGDLDARRFLR